MWTNIPASEYRTHDIIQILLNNYYFVNVKSYSSLHVLGCFGFCGGFFGEGMLHKGKSLKMYRFRETDSVQHAEYCPYKYHVLTKN